ncbi:fimbrial protein [Obesumbacterium proteus]|uniref:fimbrial protein n=1 Tax=Obesumbacterium proteus TaxID=82983 RepID=UPI00242D2753|nr:fimbrial protein [Obesumbacterium proteus]
MNKSKFEVSSFLLKIVFFLIINFSARAKTDIDINFGNIYVNELSGSTTVSIPLGSYTREGTPVVGSQYGTSLSLVGMTGCNYFTPQGNCEYKLDNDGTGIFFVLGARHGEQQRYWDSGGGLYGVVPGDVITGDLVLDNSNFIGTYRIARNQIANVRYSYKSDGYVVYVSGYVTVARTACHISTGHDMIYTWTPLSPSQIGNGSAPVKNTPITMKCVGATVPVTVTVTSSNGYADSQQGVIKTNMENLGVKLTWARNGFPVLLNTAIEFPASSETTTDFSINALPVTTTSNMKVNGGDFDAMVTVAFDYH